MGFLNLLKLPEINHIKDIDDPAVTLLHAQLINRKLLLKKLYFDFYKRLLKIAEPTNSRTLVELGSGGGFLKEIQPDILTSDILELPDVDKVFSALDMPFEDNSVDAFLMIDVLHHITDSRAFFKEALRCLRVNGKIVMIEPANTVWSRFIYKHFHHELFDQQADWCLKEFGPLSRGNGAIPWIIFSRDREIFEREFPTLRIVRMRNHTPLLYLFSGGFALRQLAPSFAYSFIKALESVLSPLNDLLGMFQTIALQKIGY